MSWTALIFLIVSSLLIGNCFWWIQQMKNNFLANELKWQTDVFYTQATGILLCDFVEHEIFVLLNVVRFSIHRRANNKIYKQKPDWRRTSYYSEDVVIFVKKKKQQKITLNILSWWSLVRAQHIHIHTYYTRDWWLYQLAHMSNTSVCLSFAQYIHTAR